MNYTEQKFTFPMKIYDGLSLRQAIKREEATEVAEEADWVQGVCRIPIEEIKAWFDVFSKGKTIDEVLQEGFDSTIIVTNTMGEFECTWPRKRFERELDEFHDKYIVAMKLKLEEEMVYEKELNARVYPNLEEVEADK